MNSEYKRYWNDYTGSAELKVGGEPELESLLQYDFCLKAGLKPSDKFLDFGCGCLRGTLGLVGYLDRGNYHGCDVSGKLLEAGRGRAIEKYGANPPIDLRETHDFDLQGTFGKLFDVVLSVSLLTHVLPSDLASCMSGVRDVLGKNGRWFFTIYPLDEGAPEEAKGDIGLMHYKRSFIKVVGATLGLHVSDYGTKLRKNPVESNQFLEKVNNTLGQWVMVARKK